MEQRNQIFGWCKARGGAITLLASLAWMNMGCSTPQVPYTDPNQPDTAWYAYQQCLETHPGINTARANICDHAGDQNSQGYYYNTNSADTGSLAYYPNYDSHGRCVSFGACYGSMGAYGYRAATRREQRAAASVSDLRAAYREHLKTLDDETLRRLTAEWLALAATPGE